MRYHARYLLLTCSLGVVLGASTSIAVAHPLKTKKGNRSVPHTHQTETGHATEANNAPGTDGKKTPGPPNSDHKFGFCAFRDSKTPKEGAAALARIVERFPEKSKEVKKEAEDFWLSKFGENWRTQVTQEPRTVGASQNCAGAVVTHAGGYDGDPGWIDPIDVTILIDDDYEPNPQGTGDSDAGCIVVYRAHNKDTGEITHVADVAEVGANGKVTKVKSRMGAWGVWTHPVGTVPDSYLDGGGWKVYRKKP